MGVDMATYKELIGHRLSIPEIERHIGADSLGYLSLMGMIDSVGLPWDKFCLSCFNGEYPFEERAGGFVERECVCMGKEG